MQIDFVDTMPHDDRNQQRTQSEQRIDGAGMTLLFLFASSAFFACWGLVMLFAWVFG